MATLFSKVKDVKLRKKFMDLLTFIVQGTTGQAGHAVVPNELVEKLSKAEAGLIQPVSGASVDAAGNIQVYATSKGVAAIQGDAPAAQAGPQAVASAPATQSAPAASTSYKLDSGFELPAAKRGGFGNREDTYPFKQMSVGQSFFVAATEERPNPAKALASTASSASKRYADKGLKFVVRARSAEDKDPGGVGARVYCIKATQEAAAAA